MIFFDVLDSLSGKETHQDDYSKFTVSKKSDGLL